MIRNMVFRTDLIDKYLQDNNLSKQEFCKQIDITLETLEKLYEIDLSITVLALFKISRRLNLYIYELFTVI